MPKKPTSERSKALQAARQRRIQDLESRRELLSLVAAGHSYQRLAAICKISVATVKRQLQRAIDERPPESAEHFIALQRERLNKALQYYDALMDTGDARSVPALLALLPHVERYWGLQQALHAQAGAAGGAQVPAPTPLKTLESESGFAPLVNRQPA
jgi:DNA-binding CsgD family transcriptional regulator